MSFIGIGGYYKCDKEQRNRVNYIMSLIEEKVDNKTEFRKSIKSLCTLFGIEITDEQISDMLKYESNILIKNAMQKNQKIELWELARKIYDKCKAENTYCPFFFLDFTNTIIYYDAYFSLKYEKYNRSSYFFKKADTYIVEVRNAPKKVYEIIYGYEKAYKRFKELVALHDSNDGDEYSYDDYSSYQDLFYNRANYKNGEEVLIRVKSNI